MCPFCWTTIGLVVAGTVSTGGLTALAAKVYRMSRTGEVLPNSEERKTHNVNQNK
jgi:hypothetical protein